MTETAAGSDLVDAVGEPVSSTHELMAQVRPGEVMGARLVRARVLGALFGDADTVGAFGRFLVRARLGAGGMGVVYEAYDPDLARGVALKLVNVAASDRETALAEAKALARLSHPNVVPIYDVGLEGEHVYLVMELVRGKTLRQWPEGRTLCEILTMYHQAGVALAAAHDVGLVHRDFKPDNAIVGTDGRVRVVDFGLACEADDPAHATRERRAVAGTPHFMAPEIKAGAAITPAADQYSFCVALAEALAHTREPAPRWIAAVLERGRAADPADRFASMGDLLRALARDPARTWRRLAAGGGVIAAVAAIAFFAGRQRPSAVGGAVDVCNDGAERLELAWSPAARAAALDRVAALGSYGRSLRPVLERGLDAHADRWADEYGAACLDRHRGAESDTMSDRRTACLERGRDALAAVRELVSHAGPAELVELPRAIQSLPDPGACSDRVALASGVELPKPAHAAPVAQVQRQIAQVRILVGAGRHEQAYAEAGAAVASARALGHGPTLAEALLVQGHARMMLAHREGAVPILAEAMAVAMASRDDALAIEAWARRAWAQGTSTDPDRALAGLDVIEPIARRTESAAFARALLYNNLGGIELARNRRAAARAQFERALTEARGVTGRGALELVAIRANLAIVTDDREVGDRLLTEVVAELSGRLGADHPDILYIQSQRALGTIEDLRQAIEILAPVCHAYERHAIPAAETARCWTEVGLMRWDLGDRGGASEAMERAARPPEEIPEAAPYAALLRGDARAAARQLADAVTARTPAPNEPWWARLDRAELSLGLGRAQRELGDLRGAREALEHAIVDLEPIVHAHPAARYERRLGRAHAELAFTLSSMGERSPERTAAATAAAAWLRRAGGVSTELAQLEGLRTP